MRTTVTIADDVLEAARAQAEASGQKLGKVISMLARRGLKGPTRNATRRGLPVFEVGPGAAIIPSSRARDMMAEEAS
jgi:hypothetical protein